MDGGVTSKEEKEKIPYAKHSIMQNIRLLLQSDKKVCVSGDR